MDPSLIESEPLVELHGVRYVRAEAVLAVTPTAITYYCAPADWPDSVVAREAVRAARIAELEAELRQLRDETEARVVCPECGRAFAAGRAYTTHRARAHGHRVPPRRSARPSPEPAPEPEPEPVIAVVVQPSPPLCRHCGKQQRPSGLKQHERYCPSNPERAEPPGSRRSNTSAPWACRVCGGTERQAVSDPSRCKPCVARAHTGEVPPAEGRPFACACGGAFAESLREPGRCIRCTGEYKAKVGRAA